MNESNGKEVATVEPKRAFSLAPTNFKEAQDFALQLSKSDLAPKDFKGKPENCLIAMQMGAEVGLSPMQAIQNIAVINGRPSVWGDAMLAICQAHRDFEWINENESDGTKGVCIAKRRGMAEQRREFTVEDAKKSGLWGKQGPWTSYPARMMKLRARAFALRDTFADALRGLQSAEEVSDYVETTATVTPSKTPVDMPKRKSEAEPAPAVSQESPTDMDVITVGDVMKFASGRFEAVSTEGVIFQLEDEALAKKLKEAKGKQVQVAIKVRDGKPFIVAIEGVVA